jgi:hypothetical protein
MKTPFTWGERESSRGQGAVRVELYPLLSRFLHYPGQGLFLADILTHYFRLLGKRSAIGVYFRSLD